MIKFIGKVIIGVFVAMVTMYIICFIYIDLHQYRNEMASESISNPEDEQKFEKRLLASCESIIIPRLKNPDNAKFDFENVSVLSMASLNKWIVSLSVQPKNSGTNPAYGIFVCSIKKNRDGSLNTTLSSKTTIGFI